MISFIVLDFILAKEVVFATAIIASYPNENVLDIICDQVTKAYIPTVIDDLITKGVITEEDKQITFDIGQKVFPYSLN